MTILQKIHDYSRDLIPKTITKKW